LAKLKKINEHPPLAAVGQGDAESSSLLGRGLFAVSLGVYVLASWMLLSQRGWWGWTAILMGLALTFLDLRRPHLGLLAVLFLIPSAGFLNNISPRAQAIPFLLGPFSGWCIAAAIRTRRPSGDLRSVPAPVFMLGAATLVLLTSSLRAAFRYAAAVWPDLAQPVAPQARGWAGPLSGDHALGWIALGTVIMASGLLFFWLNVRERPMDFTSVRRALFLGFLPAVGLGSYQVISDFDAVNSAAFRGTGRINATFVDPNAFAMAGVLVFPLFIGWASFSRRPATGWRRFSQVAAISLLLYLLLFTGSRAAFGALLLSLAFLFFLVYRWGPGATEARRVVASVLASLAVVALFAAFSPRVPLLQRLSAPIFVTGNIKDFVSEWQALPGGRWEIWRRATVLAQQAPVLGSGPGTYLIEARRLEAEFPMLPTPNDNACSHYLQLWAETGLAGLAIVVLIWLRAWRRGVSFLKTSFDPGRASILAAVSGMFVALVFGSHLLNFEVNLLFWLFLAFLWRERPL
jgi:O-antigen ligase